MVKKSLIAGDRICEELCPWMNSKRKYYSAIAKILHVWRDYAKSWHTAWKKLFVALDARKYAAKRPPLALSGRWGAVHNGELHILAPPIQQLRSVADKVLPNAKVLGNPVLPPQLAIAAGSAATSSSATASVNKAIAGTDEIALEETQAHSRKMGMWKNDAGLAIKDEMFIPIIVQLMNRARAPLQRWFYWLEKGEEEVVLDGHKRRCGLVAQMVWFKADDVLKELYDLTFIEGWSDLIKLAPPLARPRVVDCILLITVQHYSDFNRRVVKLMRRQPLKMLWIAHALPHVDAKMRREVCAEVLAAIPADLHITAFKLRRSFYAELVIARDTGKCPKALYALVNSWAIYIPSNTQAIEGLNNSIVLATKQAPAMLMPLLSSRIVGRALALPLAGATGLPKFSVLVPSLEETLQAAVDFFHDGTKVLEDVARFVTPPPSQRTTPHRKVDPASVPSVAQVWAARYNAKWATALRKQTNGWWLRGMLAFQLPGDARPSVWACGLMYKYHGEMLACDVEVAHHDGGGGSISVRLQRPFQVTTSLELFANMYEARQFRLPFSFAQATWENVAISCGEVRSAELATLKGFEALGNLAPWASGSTGAQTVLLQIGGGDDASKIEAEAAAIICPHSQADDMDEMQGETDGVVDATEFETEAKYAGGDDVVELDAAIGSESAACGLAPVLTSADWERVFEEWAASVQISVCAALWAATRQRELPGTNLSLLAYVGGRVYMCCVLTLRPKHATQFSRISAKCVLFSIFCPW